MFMVHRVMIKMGLKGLSTLDERHESENEQKRARTSDIRDISNSRYISDSISIAYASEIRSTGAYGLPIYLQPIISRSICCQRNANLIYTLI